MACTWFFICSVGLAACGGGESMSQTKIESTGNLKIGMSAESFFTYFHQPVFSDGSTGLGDFSPQFPHTPFELEPGLNLSAWLSFENNCLSRVTGEFDYQSFFRIKQVLAKNLNAQFYCETAVSFNLKVAPVEYSVCTAQTDQGFVEVSERHPSRPFTGYFKVFDTATSVLKY